MNDAFCIQNREHLPGDAGVSTDADAYPDPDADAGSDAGVYSDPDSDGDADVTGGIDAAAAVIGAGAQAEVLCPWTNVLVQFMLL